MSRNTAARKTSQPFLYDCFNVKIYYANFATRGLARILNALIEAFNERHRLPAYIIIIPDKDIITHSKNYNISNGIVMGSAIHFLIRQFDLMVKRCQLELVHKKPGTVMDELKSPKFIWVRMLKRPDFGTKYSKAVFGLRGKFNSMLEDHLKDGKDDNHRIMSINIRPDQFDLLGNLTSAGKAEFWNEINRAMKKFHNGDITLNPRNFALKSNKPQVVPVCQKTQPSNFVQKVHEDHWKHTKFPAACKRLNYSPNEGPSNRRLSPAKKLPTPPKNSVHRSREDHCDYHYDTPHRRCHDHRCDCGED